MLQIFDWNFKIFFNLSESGPLLANMVSCANQKKGLLFFLDKYNPAPGHIAGFQSSLTPLARCPCTVHNLPNLTVPFGVKQLLIMCKSFAPLLYSYFHTYFYIYESRGLPIYSISCSFTL